MKALSIKQPWAWCILHACKDVENRDWKPWNAGLKFRGEFLIHTGAKLDSQTGCGAAISLARHAGHPIPALQSLNIGGFVGVAEIFDVVDDDEPLSVPGRSSPWYFGPRGLLVRNPRLIPFVPAKGQLGFFDVDMTPQLEHYIKEVT